MDESYQRKVGAILSYVSIFISMAISIIYTPFLLKKLGQSEYGLYSLMANFISYINLVDLGFGNAMIVFLSKSTAKDSKEETNKTIGSFFKLYIVLGLVSLIVGICLYFSIDKVFAAKMTILELSKAKTMFKILLIPLVVSFPLGVFGSLITIKEKFIFEKILYILRTLMVPFIMVPLLLKGYKSITLVTVISIVSICAYIINFIYCKKQLQIKMVFAKTDKKLFKEIFNYSILIFLTMVVDKINNSVDSVILGITSGTIVISVFAIGQQFNNMFINFSTGISSVFLPKISKMVAKDDSGKELSQMFIKVSRIQFLIIGLIITGFILFGSEFISYWAGKEYSTSYYIAVILMISYTIPLIQNLGVSILQAQNKNLFRVICYLIISVLNIAISIPLAKAYQGVGSAIGTAFAMIVGNVIIMNIYFNKKCNLNMKEFWSEISKMFLTLIPLFIIGIALNIVIHGNIYLLVIKIVIYTLIYISIVWNFSVNEYEKGLVRTIMNKIFKKRKKRNNND